MLRVVLIFCCAGFVLSGEVIILDRDGRQGTVPYDHEAHVKVAPDRLSPYPSQPGATCAGCHHTRNKRGVIQLDRCASCHRSEGDPANPKSRSFNEVHTKRAFHDQCIGCHISAAKGPLACADCHQTARRGDN